MSLCEGVKSARIKVPLIGARVSVNRNHFGEKYASNFPIETIPKFIGTVKHKLSGRARVEWDIDKEVSEVDFGELTIEDPDCPIQKAGESSGINDEDANEGVDFVGEEVVEGDDDVEMADITSEAEEAEVAPKSPEKVISLLSYFIDHLFC